MGELDEIFGYRRADIYRLRRDKMSPQEKFIRIILRFIEKIRPYLKGRYHVN